MVNDFELIVPKYFANKVIRNKKPKLRLLNPVSKERNIASRKNQLVIPIKRKNVRKPMLIEVKNEPVDETKFTPTDRERLERYNPIDDLEEIKQAKTLKFKNETRGLPFVLYANLKKKNYTPEQLEKMVRKLLALLGFDYDDLSKKQQEVIKDKVEQRMEFNESKEEEKEEVDEVVDDEVPSDEEIEYEDEEGDDKLTFTKNQIIAFKDEKSYLNSLLLGSKKEQEQALMKIPITRLYSILAILKNDYFEKEGYFTLEDRSIMNFTKQTKSVLVNLILLEQNKYEDASLLGLIEDRLIEDPNETEAKKLTKQQKERLELLGEKARESKALVKLREVVKVKLQRLREAKTKREKEKAEEELRKARKKELKKKKEKKPLEEKADKEEAFNELMKEFMELDKKSLLTVYKPVRDTLSKITYEDLKQSVEDIKKTEKKERNIKLEKYKDYGGVAYTSDELTDEFLKIFKTLIDMFKIQYEPRSDYQNVNNEVIFSLVFKLNQMLFYHRVEIKQWYKHTPLEEQNKKDYPRIISTYMDDITKYLSSFTVESGNIGGKVVFKDFKNVREFIQSIIRLKRFSVRSEEMLEVISKPVTLPRNTYSFPKELEEKTIKLYYNLPNVYGKIYARLVWKKEKTDEKEFYYGGTNWTGFMKNRGDTDADYDKSWEVIQKYLLENGLSEGSLVSRKENPLTLKYIFNDDYYDNFIINQSIRVTKKGKKKLDWDYDYKIERFDIDKPKKVEGKGLKDTDFKNIIEATYKPRDIQGWTLDKSISSGTSKVWKKNDGNQVVIAHRGTQGFLDWANNAMFAMGGETAYKLTPRYKEAYRVQKLAERKYGRDYKISTIGHSQGGLQAQLLGHRSDETITFNKATRPSDLISASKQRKNQYDYSTRGDPVSVFRSPFEKYKSLNVKGSYNPLHAHSTKSIKESGEIYGNKSFY